MRPEYRIKSNQTKLSQNNNEIVMAVVMTKQNKNHIGEDLKKKFRKRYRQLHDKTHSKVKL